MRSVLWAAVGLFLTSASAQAAIKVVASIKPVHSLAAGLMQGVGEPSLIVSGGASPHVYSLKPSQARALENADVVFWIGEGLENFLEKPLEALAGDAQIVALSEVQGLTLLKPREGGSFDAHHHEGEEEHAHEEGHEHEHEKEHAHEERHAHAGHGDDDHEEKGHDHEREESHAHHDDETDMHLWLDPENARLIVSAMEKALIAADPANEERYKANAAKLQARIETLLSETEARVTPVSDKQFIVFHDAYHYFENRFGIEAAGSITVSPETAPGAKRLSEIRGRIADTGAVCVFSEPQFPSSLVSTVLEGTDARAGTLDPLGASLDDGPDLYFKLIANLATSLTECLSKAG